MGLKSFRPTSPGRRGMTAVVTEELTDKKPEKSLTAFHLGVEVGTTMAG